MTSHKKKLNVLHTISRTMLLFSLVVLSLVTAFSVVDAEQQQPSCSLSEHEKNALDPNLHEMEYDVGDGPQKTLVYIEPDIATFYQDGNAPAKTKVTPKFNSLSGKFINMSNKPVSFYWEATKGGTKHIMRHLLPFGVAGTATFPGHSFVFTESEQPDNIIIRFIIKKYPENIYYYDPYHVEGDPKQTEKNLSVMTKDEREKYDMWRKTILFNEQYKAKTGRSYLANYLRARPIHYLWPADYFGQEHWITTRETHFVDLPPRSELKMIPAMDGRGRVLKEDQPRLLQDYRVPDQTIMNMTLKVLSVAPRVLEIPNFLSQVEVDHITELASGENLKLSSTGEYVPGEKKIESEDSRRVRTSRNSWVPREKTPIIDAIYRRAADLMRIDESLFRWRTPDENPPNVKTIKTMAEQLQLVHYGPGQEYTAHHDFGYVMEDKIQDARFATLLLYLNKVPKGGETSFPRYVNGETFKELNVAPDTPGKAVLFYSQLPDGNLDDFSQHAALPVIEGEKWLINLWVHDPVYGS